MSKKPRNPLSFLDPQLSQFIYRLAKGEIPGHSKSWRLSKVEADNLRFALYTHRRLLSQLLIISSDPSKEQIGHQIKALSISSIKLPENNYQLTISLSSPIKDKNHSRYSKFLSQDEVGQATILSELAPNLEPQTFKPTKSLVNPIIPTC